MFKMSSAEEMDGKSGMGNQFTQECFKSERCV